VNEASRESTPVPNNTLAVRAEPTPRAFNRKSANLQKLIPQSWMIYRRLALFREFMVNST